MAYLRAWAANDVATMVRNSELGAPARTFARYWHDVYRAGRLDAGQAEVELAADRVTLTYADGTTYAITQVQVSDAGLVTWSARPGGPLASRIVAGPAVAARVGRVTVRALRQYVNSDGDLRVSLQIRNDAAARRDLFARGYRSPDGRPSTATVGFGGATGVIRVPGGAAVRALVSVERTSPGGRLTLVVVDGRGTHQGSVVLSLPR